MGRRLIVRTALRLLAIGRHRGHGAADRLMPVVEASDRRRQSRLRAGIPGLAVLVVGGGLVAAPAAADIVREFLAQTGSLAPQP